jgi:hypothetical protein
LNNSYCVRKNRQMQMIPVKGIRIRKLIQTLLSSNINLPSGNYHCRLSPSRRPESEWILSICLESSFLSLNFDSQYGQETWLSVDIQGYFACVLHLSWSLWIILYLRWRFWHQNKILRNYITYRFLNGHKFVLLV